MNPGDTRYPPKTSRSGSSLNEGRGVNPGDTADPQRAQRSLGVPLNEGRGVNPGDTRLLAVAEPVAARSTKAGA